MSDFTRRLSWGRHKTLQRFHYALGEVFALQDHGEHRAAQALVAQLMKGTHQCMLDDGSWAVAWHVTCLRDPLRRER